jgi:predicted RNA-binding protein
MIAEGTYTPPPILAADGVTDLRQVLVEWNATAREMTECLSSLTNETSAEAAVPQLKNLAKQYESHYRTVWRSGVEPGKLRDIIHGHVQSQKELETALRWLKFERRTVFDRLRLVTRRLTPCDIDLGPNFDQQMRFHTTR